MYLILKIYEENLVPGKGLDHVDLSAKTLREEGIKLVTPELNHSLDPPAESRQYLFLRCAIREINI